MDTTNVANQTLIEMMHKSQSLARQDLYGIKSKYCWDELIFKFKAVQLIESETAEEATKKCATFLLNDTLDSKIVNTYINTITNVYVPVYEQHYHGVIPDLNTMTNIDNEHKNEGWWWSITGNFTFEGVDYTAGDEIYWNSTGFHFFGGTGSGGGGTYLTGVRISTGPLEGLVEKTLPHTLGREPYILQAKDGNNIYFVNTLKVDPANPTTKVIIMVEESLIDGLTITLV
jgi:hypothetical protein